MIWFLQWVADDIQFFIVVRFRKVMKIWKMTFIIEKEISETERYHDVKVILQSIEWY